MRPEGRVTAFRRAVCASRADLVSHEVPRAAKVLRRRVREKIRHARRIDARVLLDLRAEAGLLVALFQERPPVRVKARVASLFYLAELGGDPAQAAAHPFYRALHPGALRLARRDRH